MSELKILFDSVLKEVETKVIEEVTALKANYETEKQQLIADFTAEKEALKARIELLCRPVSSTIVETTTIPSVTAPLTEITPA
jgi:hypothetical protein